MNLHVLPDFKVIDESEDWLVVDKPAPLIVHPANRQDEPSLLEGVRLLLAYERANGCEPAIVNRLDRETSGLVLVAKHKEAARELGMRFERREVFKEYLAIVHGWPAFRECTVTEPLLRAGEVGPSDIWVRQIVHPQGKNSITRISVVDRFEVRGNRFSLLRCVPETGRMHQIRVHLKCCGHPIVGDKIYSERGEEYLEWMRSGWSDSLQDRLWLPRHALHAYRLGMFLGDRRLTWECPLPRDLRSFLHGDPIRQHTDIVIWNREG